MWFFTPTGRPYPALTDNLYSEVTKLRPGIIYSALASTADVHSAIRMMLIQL